MSVLDRFYYESKKIKDYVCIGGDSYSVRHKWIWAIYDRRYSSSEPIALVDQVFYAEMIVKKMNIGLQE